MSGVEARIYKENWIIAQVYFNILLKLMCCIFLSAALPHNLVAAFERGIRLCSFTSSASCIKLPHKSILSLELCPQPVPEPARGSSCSDWVSSHFIGKILHS